MRTKNSIRNVLLAFISNFLTIVIGVLAQAIFIKTLGNEFLGLNGLFSNIISLLNIAELGIGSAIIYNLYKPIAQGDVGKINALLKFYKKCYHIIAIIILLFGFLLIPFLGSFVGEINVDVNVTFIYILFIIEIVVSYLLSYKQAIINANQQNYIVNLIHISYLVILNTLQIGILLGTKNYYLYLGIKIFMRFYENILLTYLANKMYPYLKNASNELDKETKEDIFQKVKALFFHKIGSFIVMGTDNIIIAKFLGIVTVGFYSNYSLIIDAVQKLFGQIIKVLTPSIGSLLIESNQKKSFEVFSKIRFLNYWIATFSGIAILIIMDSFISIWIGNEYVLEKLVLYVLVFNYYQKSMRTSYMVFKEAAGIFYEDRFVPLIESFLNIFASIILLKFFGLAGVFMGTIVSGLALWGYSYPKYVYKDLLHRDYALYIKETMGYIILFVIVAFITVSITNIFVFSNLFWEFTKNVLIAIIVPNVILLLVFMRTNNFNYYFDLMKNILFRGNKNEKY